MKNPFDLGIESVFKLSLFPEIENPFKLDLARQSHILESLGYISDDFVSIGSDLTSTITGETGYIEEDFEDSVEVFIPKAGKS